MPWFKVDDRLYSSAKWSAATKGARALWTTAASWCAGQESDGFVPSSMLRLFDGTKREAACLVEVGLWEVDEEAGGWRFHNWTEYNPDSASKKAKKKNESAGGRRGNHVRWHEKKKIRVPGCEWCEPSGTRSTPDREPESPPESPPNPPVPVPVPVPLLGSVGVEPPDRSNREPDPAVGHIHEPNARRALAALVAENDLPLDVDELLGAAYRLGSGDPWAGYMREVKPRCEQSLEGARNPAAVLRARLRSDVA